MTSEDSQKTKTKLPTWAWVVIGVLGISLLGAIINPKGATNSAEKPAPTAVVESPAAVEQEPSVTPELTPTETPAVEVQPAQVEEPAAEPPAAVAAQPAPKVATSAGLTESGARVACMAAGDRLLKYGGKIRWIMGAYPAQLSGDQWFFKVEAEPKNEYGVKVRGSVFECYVGGSEQAPAVSDAYLY